MDQVEFFNDIRSNLGENAVALHQRLWDKYGEPECGNSRVTYISKNYVFKLPITEQGIRQNEDECTLLSDDYWQFAKTRLVDAESGLLCMERVDHASHNVIQQRLGHVSEFVSGIDCSQVGFNRRGHLVAYDFATTY